MGDAQTDELYIVVKYHGEAADNPDEQARLGRQLSRLLGNCEQDIEMDDTLDRCPDLHISLFPAE